MFSWKKVVIGLAVIFLAILSIRFGLPLVYDGMSDDLRGKAESKRHSALTESVSGDSQRPDSEENDEAIASPGELHEINQWLGHRGYFIEISPDSLGAEPILSDYDSYDKDTLRALAQENGDPRALQLLGEKYYQDGDMDRARISFYEAAVRGFTSNLHDVSYLELQNAHTTSHDSPDDERQAILQAAAWVQVAAELGDYFAAMEVGLMPEGDHLMISQTETSIGAAHATVYAHEREAFDEIVEDRLSAIKEHRSRMGLGPFDQTCMPYYERFLDLAAQKLESLDVGSHQIDFIRGNYCK